MRLRLPVFLLLLGTWGGVVWAAENSATRTDAYFFAPSIGQTINSFEDLEARDDNNQPVKSIAAKEDLETLFRTSLFLLLVNADTYSTAQSLAAIKKTFKLDVVGLVRNLPRVFSKVTGVLLPTRQEWDKILLRLSNFFVFCLLAVFLSLTSRRLPLSRSGAAPLVLRC